MVHTYSNAAHTLYIRAMRLRGTHGTHHGTLLELGGIKMHDAQVHIYDTYL